MAFSESLAARVRQAMTQQRQMSEQRMFGGVGFLLRGNMCVGIWQNALIVRVGPREYAGALSSPFVREFDITGRPMTGWIIVEPEGLDTDRDLHAWVQRAVDFVGTLPSK